MHCSSAVVNRDERTSKLGQKFVRAGVLQPLCALLALSVPAEVSITTRADTHHDSEDSFEHNYVPPMDTLQQV